MKPSRNIQDPQSHFPRTPFAFDFYSFAYSDGPWWTPPGFNGESLPRQQLVEAVKRNVECSRSTAYRIVDAALKAGLFSVDEKGIVWFEYVMSFPITAIGTYVPLLLY